MSKTRSTSSRLACDLEYGRRTAQIRPWLLADLDLLSTGRLGVFEFQLVDHSA